MPNPERFLKFWDLNLFGWKHQGYTHGTSQIGDPCPDEVEYRLTINCEELMVVDVWARGCVMVHGGAAMLADLARGKDLAWLRDFSEEDWIKYADVEIKTDAKRNCLLLPLQCLKSAVYTPFVEPRSFI
jgi:hypothetical protein